MIKKAKAWAKNLKRKIFILYYACKDDRVPWYAKVFIACIVAYAFSPIDLIPDFIPIIGYLDEVIFLPLGIILALKRIPKDVLSVCEVKAEVLMRNGMPKNWIGGCIIILIWVAVMVWAVIKLYPLFS
ncbi:YkvA family protein [Mesobacillus foraminis]|uniref:YkvA family protein n=1 Tax=Mesobacillus foraminis TaxID=279826 RepID=UPI000EF4E91A|nr:YkvA family protein [Mesobacillus foraminis]